LELPRDHVSAGAFIERTIRDALHTGAEEEDVERLVDAKDNEFVISNPKSGTMELQQDLRLIRDLVVVLVAAAIGAVAFTMMGQPLITGYLVAGAAVGPGGLGSSSSSSRWRRWRNSASSSSCSRSAWSFRTPS
jgi:hypothetical protein